MTQTRKKPLPAERSAAFTRSEIRLLGAAVVLAAATSLILSMVDSASAAGGLGSVGYGATAEAAPASE